LNLILKSRYSYKRQKIKTSSGNELFLGKNDLLIDKDEQMPLQEKLEDLIYYLAKLFLKN